MWRLRIMRKKGLLALLSFFLIALFLGSCGTSDTPSKQADAIKPYIDKGKVFLEQGQYAAAKAKFQYVLHNIDFSNPEANYGFVIADFLDFSDIIRTISSLSGSLSSMSEDENLFIRDMVHDLLMDLYKKFDEIDKHLLFVMGDPSVEFNLGSTPVYLSSATTPTLDLGGEWDRADAFLLDAIAQAVKGVLNFALSIDLRGDFIGAYDYINQIGMNNLNLSKIMNILVYLLNTPVAGESEPNFLGLDPDGGKARWEQAGLNFATALQNLTFAFYLSGIETDPQGNDVLGFIPTKPDGTKCTQAEINSNGVKYCSLDEREAMKDIDVCSLPPDTITGISTINIIVGKDGKKEPMEMQNTAGTACLFQKLQQSLDYTDGKDVKIYLISELLPPLLGMVLNAVPNLPSSISSLLNANVLKSLFGDPVALELGNFFAEAPRHGLRDLLPAWDTGDNPDNNFFVIEKECPNNVPEDNPFYLRALTNETGKLSLDKDALMNILFPCSNPADFSHFSFSYPDFPTISKIPADGIPNSTFTASSLYIAFQDPSFNNMLFLNFDPSHRPPNTDSLPNQDLLGYGLQKANLYNLNVFLQVLMNVISNVLGG